MTVLVDLALALDRAAVVSLNGPAAALAICVRVLTKGYVNIGEPEFLYEVLLLDLLLGSLLLYVFSCRVATKRRSTSA